MGGNPWLRMILVLIGFACAGYPVWSLTQRPNASLESQVVPSQKMEQLLISISFSSSPKTFTLSYLNQPLLHQVNGQEDYSLEWNTALPPEGIDLLLKADSGHKTAVKVVVSHDGLPLVEKLFWTTSDLTELITIPPQGP